MRSISLHFQLNWAEVEKLLQPNPDLLDIVVIYTYIYITYVCVQWFRIIILELRCLDFDSKLKINF